ncbi:S8 family serine peptidase [Streptomyces sp. NPDC090080]|uniref:S8 family serine peptidase n=1 Tax=Streptomyces sp. NPDC090080 TaxID=3365939 RepID=UPI00381E8300
MKLTGSLDRPGYLYTAAQSSEPVRRMTPPQKLYRAGKNMPIVVSRVRAWRRRRLSVLAPLLIFCAAAATAPQAQAHPLASDEIRLPVIPSDLSAGEDHCTDSSPTVLKQTPWAQTRLHLAQTQRISKGAGVTVGVVDTGVTDTAPALAGRVRGDTSAMNDCVGHGTFIAGVIAAHDQEGTPVVGVAPSAAVYAARGTDNDGRATASLVARGIREAVGAGARVIDVSAALPSANTALRSALVFATDHDVLVVAPAAPDESVTTSTSSDNAQVWPAAARTVLSVVDTDIDGNLSQTETAPQKADLSAPGQAVAGIGPVGKGHFLGSGPTVATAFVAGAAALVRSYHPELSAEDVADRLVSSAYPGDVPALDIQGALTRVTSSTVDEQTADPGMRPPTATHTQASLQRTAILTAVCAVLILVVAAAVGLTRRVRSRSEI